MGFLEHMFGQQALGSTMTPLEVPVPRFIREAQQQQEMAIMMARAYHPTNIETQNPEGTLVLIKKSIKEIKDEAVSEKVQGRIQAKIDRLLDAGALAQATILDVELRMRQKLNHLQEWDYKVLPAEEIGRFESENRVTATRDGIRVHIDLLENYQGNPVVGDAKDRIIPDDVLDELDKAKERKLFDKFHVLWVERVPDPLLLGSIDGCKDYFLICEWGDDISFDQIITKGE